MLIYAWDERRLRASKKAALNRKHRWGTYQLQRKSKFEPLPSYHPLSLGNLPK
jgi:hypothetical protein